MRTKLMSLTPEQEARMGSFAQEWIQRGWRTTPLTEEEWAVWEAGARKCYEYAGIPWPGVVVRVPSPLVGAFAAPAAAYTIALRKRLAVRGAVDGAVGDAVDGAVGDAVGGAVRDAVGDAVRGAVGDAVGGAVRGAVGDAVRDAVGDAVDGAVRGAVGGAVDGAVGDAVRDAVDGAVGDAVDGAVRDAVKSLYYYRFGGTIWAGWWQSYVAFFRDIVELEISDELWDRSRAFDDAKSAGWWWPFRDFVMVCDVPSEIHVEQVAPTGWGSHRLHREDGPAVVWADGWGVYSWHGTRVPSDLVDTGWGVERIMAEKNTEIRRCAIERFGWDRFVVAAGMKLADECADPGNPGQVLRLYDVPRKVLNLPVRVLVCSNATRERNGQRHTFGLTIPTDCRTALSAAAWTFDLTEREYEELARAT